MQRNRRSFSRTVAVFAVGLSLLAGAALAPPASAQSGTYPNQPFNGLQITYSVSGASGGAPQDTFSFTTSRVYKGQVTGSTLTVSGSAKCDHCTPRYWADVSVVVQSGGQSKTHNARITTQGGTSAFNLSVPAQPGGGSFSITMVGQYNVGTRTLVVSGDFGGGPAVPVLPTPAPKPTLPPAPEEMDTGQAVMEQVTGALHEFDGDCFGKIVRLGDPALYRQAARGVEYDIDPNYEGDSMAEHRVWQVPGLAAFSPSVIMREDPRTARDRSFASDLRHELTHQLEYLNGDRDASRSGQEPFDERNTWYMDHTIVELRSLALMIPSSRAADPNVPALIKQWQTIIGSIRAAEEQGAKGGEKPDLDVLERWTGFHARADEIEALMASGECGGLMKGIATGAPGLPSAGLGDSPPLGISDVTGQIMELIDVPGLMGRVPGIRDVTFSDQDGLVVAALEQDTSYIAYGGDTLNPTQGTITLRYVPVPDLREVYSTVHPAWTTFRQYQPPMTGFVLDTVGWAGAYTGSFELMIHQASVMQWQIYDGRRWQQAIWEIPGDFDWSPEVAHEIAVSYGPRGMWLMVDGVARASSEYTGGLDTQHPWYLGHEASNAIYGPHTMLGWYADLRVLPQQVGP